MKKTLNTAAITIAAIAIVAVSHRMEWRMYEWTRVLLFLPPLYAAMHLRKADAFATAMITLLGIAPVAIELLKKNNVWFINFSTAAIALIFTGVYIGIVIKKQSENSKTVSQAHEILQSLRKGSSADDIYDTMQKIFNSRCESESACIYLLDSGGFLRKRHSGEEPLPEKHLFYLILASGSFFISNNISIDKRIGAASSSDAPGISQLIAYPIIAGGKPRGIITVTDSRLERISGELISLLAAIRTSVENSLELIEKREKTIHHEIRRRKLRDNLASYVSSKFLEKLPGGGEDLSLGGDTRYVTVMFTEISNFRELAGGMEPGELIAMLNEFFSAAIDVVFEFDGTMDKFIGHNIMAFWGAPVPLEDCEARAVKCAHELQKKLETLNAQWRALSKPQFRMSIGINSGEAVAGTIGSLRRMEYTVIGDTVNIAARIKSLSGSQGIPILVGEQTHAKVKDSFSFSGSFTAELKGKSGRVNVFELDVT